MSILYGRVSMGLARWWVGYSNNNQWFFAILLDWATCLHLTRMLHQQVDTRGFMLGYVLERSNEQLFSFLRRLMRPGKGDYFTEEMGWVQGCWSRRFHPFSPRYLDTFVGFLVLLCLGSCLFFFVLALKVPGSFAHSCMYSLTSLRASLTDNAWN